MFGLFTFFYACAHFAIYIGVDQFFAFDLILKDVVKRPFITMGFTAFVLMIPLALTSTKGWIRRLGRRWQAASSPHLYMWGLRSHPLPMEGQGDDRLAGLLRHRDRRCFSASASSGS